MEKLFLITAIIFQSTISVISQIIVDNTKVWSTGKLSCEGQPFSSYYTKFEGDTIINSVSYFKIWKSRDEYHTEWQQVGFIREEDKKVFQLIGFEEILLYDFNLAPGDSISTENVEYLKVDSIVSKTINNEAKNFYYLSSSFFHQWGPVIWVEGIGSLSGIMNNTGYIGLVGGMDILLCFTENDTLKYSDPNYNTCYFKDITNVVYEEDFRKQVKIYPNPSTGSFFLQVENSKNKEFVVSIFNNTGQLVFERNYQNKKVIEINSLVKGKGFYTIQVTGERLLYTGRLVIY